MRQRNPSSGVLSLNPAVGLSAMWWEMYWAALTTITYRLGAMALAGASPDRAQQRENRRMISEKVEAGLETAQILFTPLPGNLMNPWWQIWTMTTGTNAQLMNETTRFWQSSSQWPFLAGSHLMATAEDALRPWHRRTTANARRLQRKKRR